MKRILIIRHGKAVPYGYEDDFTRDLRERGRNDAGLIGQELKRRKVFPDMIISSPATRAINTARIFAGELDFDLSAIVEMEDIYEGLTTTDFLDIVQDLPEEANTVFFFGHNPGFYYFVCNLLEDFRGDMPTTSTVGIDFEVSSWKEVEARTGEMAFQLIPRMFK